MSIGSLAASSSETRSEMAAFGEEESQGMCLLAGVSLFWCRPWP